MSEQTDNDTVGSLKIRVANMLLNTIALSESMNIIRDACVSRAEEIVNNASTEQLDNIKTQVNNYEQSLNQEQREVNDQAAAADPAPAEEATGPDEYSGASGPSGPSGPDPSGCSI